MANDDEERFFHVCAPIDTRIVIYQALGRTDWKQSFDVLELDWEQRLPSWEGFRPEALELIESLLPAALALLERLHGLAAAAQSRGVRLLFLF